MSKVITTSELIQKQQEGQLVLMNVVTAEYHAQAHIRGSVNCCVYEIAFLENVQQAFPEKYTPFVVYGRNKDFQAASKAAGILASAGYSQVWEYRDGIEGWIEHQQSVEGTGLQTDSGLQDGTYAVNTHDSFVAWEGSNIANRHYGKLALEEGYIKIQNGTPQEGYFVIDMETLTCEDLTDQAMNKMLVSHLKSPDFFEVEQYPEASCRIISAKKISDARYGEKNIDITAEFSIKNQKKEVQFEAMMHSDDQGDWHVHAYVEINRADFGVMYGSGRFYEWLGQHIVNDIIALRIKLKLQKQ